MLELSFGEHSYGYGLTPDSSDLWGFRVHNSEPGMGSDSVFFSMEEQFDNMHSFSLTDYTGTALSSDALPTDWNLGDWDSGQITRSMPGYSPGLIVSDISGLRPVPDMSATGLLLALALLSLGWLVKKENIR